MPQPKRFQPVNKLNLRRLRMENGWSQDELAKQAGYSERLIRKAEAGGTVRSQTIRDIAEALSLPEAQVTYEDLVLDHLAIAKQFVQAYDCGGQRMLDHCEEILHESFVFHCPGHSDQVPTTVEWVGVAGMQAFFDRFYSTFTRMPGSLKPTYTVGEDHVCAQFIDQVFFQGHGLPKYWVNLQIHFQDGLISRIDNEYDTQAAASDFTKLLDRLHSNSAT